MAQNTQDSPETGLHQPACEQCSSGEALFQRGPGCHRLQATDEEARWRPSSLSLSSHTASLSEPAAAGSLMGRAACFSYKLLALQDSPGFSHLQAMKVSGQ